MPSTNIYHKNYYLEQKKKIMDYNKKYRNENRIYYKLYYLNNRDKLLDYGKAYYKNHTERCRFLNIQWKKNNIPGYQKTKQPLTFQRVKQNVVVSFD